MHDHPSATSPPPSISELGTDLLRISRPQRVLTLLTPFVTVAAYLVAAHFRA